MSSPNLFFTFLNTMRWKEKHKVHRRGAVGYLCNVCMCNILHYIIFKEEKGTSSESIEHFLKLFLRWTSGADHGRVLLVTGSFSSMTQGAWQTCRSDLSLILATMTVPQPSETYRNQHNNGIAIKIAASWWIFYARGWQLNRSKVRQHLKEILTDFLNY